MAAASFLGRPRRTRSRGEGMSVCEQIEGGCCFSRGAPVDEARIARCSLGSALDLLTRFAEVAAAGRVALHHEINVGIMHALAGGARADLEIDGVAVAAVDEAMGDATARFEAGGVAGLEHGLAVVFLKDQLAFEHVDELVLLLVP